VKDAQESVQRAEFAAKSGEMDKQMAVRSQQLEVEKQKREVEKAKKAAGVARADGPGVPSSAVASFLFGAL
jgi:hypothetical protein